MALEFSCYRCGQKITIEDGLPEQMFSCPHCGALIAHGGTDPASQARMPPPASQDQFWQVSPSEPQLSTFTFSSVFEDAWNIGIKRWQPFLLLAVIGGGITMVLSLIVSFGFLALIYVPLIFSAMQDRPAFVHEPPELQWGENLDDESEWIPEAAMDRALAGNEPEIPWIFLITGGLFVLLVAMFISLAWCWIYAGEIMLVLAIARGEEAKISLIFKGLKYFWRIVLVCANRTILLMLVWFVITLVTFFPVLYYVASVGTYGEPSTMGVILSIAGVVLGCTLMVVCSLYISVVFVLSDYFVVDRDLGAIEAMRSSYIFVRPHFWKVLGFLFFLTLAASAAGSIPLVGALLMVPIGLMLWAVLYLKATGQKNCLTSETKAEPTLP